MKKNIIIYLILIILIFVISVLSIQIIGINRKLNQTQTSFSKDKINISNPDYETSITNIQKELNTLTKNVENTPLDTVSKEEYNQTINNLTQNINELKNQYNSLPDYSNMINNLNTKINYSDTNYLANSEIDKKIIGKWQSTVIHFYLIKNENNPYGLHSPMEENAITTYEFKQNHDFYINDIHVGTYSNGEIFYHDIPRENGKLIWRTAKYYYINNILYINLYYGNTDNGIYQVINSSIFYEAHNV